MWLGVGMALLHRSLISLPRRTEAASILPCACAFGLVGDQIQKCYSFSEGRNYMKHTFYDVDSYGVHL